MAMFPVMDVTIDGRRYLIKENITDTPIPNYRFDVFSPDYQFYITYEQDQKGRFYWKGGDDCVDHLLAQKIGQQIEMDL